MPFIAFHENTSGLRLLKGNSKAKREVEVETFAERIISWGNDTIEIVVFDTDDIPSEVFTFATATSVAKVS